MNKINRTCETCINKDICKYADELKKAQNKILVIDINKDYPFYAHVICNKYNSETYVTRCQ